MTFRSILFGGIDEGMNKETPGQPVFFPDLNLDQIIESITRVKEEYNLKPFFYIPLTSVDAIKYRHEIFRDFENGELFENIRVFERKIRLMREYLAQSEKLYYKYQKESWFLDAVEIYCDAVNNLVHDLSLADVKSRGFLGLREYLTNYAASERFTSLLAETKKLKTDLSSVKYCVLVKYGSFQVRKYENEIDYTAEVEETFDKFKQGAVEDYRVKFTEHAEMNHIEAKILDFVAQLYPDIFSGLDEYCSKKGDYLDETIGVFDREIQFYIAYLDYVAIFRRAGLQSCYPQITDTGKEVYDYECYDSALAHKLINEKSPVVSNDFYLHGKERVFVVSGPNQGGKTTFARTFGQLHYLASLGCLVPGREARLFLFDRLFTHFEKEEDITNLRGKLKDDLVRIHEILSQATPNSIIIMNEIFTSTTLQDAVFLSEKVMEKIIKLGLLCVWVSFIEELASFGEETVSIVSTVDPENPATRTFKIIRKPADGLAYALSIAEKYRLTYDHLRERIKA